jgi:hypothetical protein
MPAATFPIGAVIRDLWPQKDIARAYIEDKPSLGLIPKKTDFFERKRHFYAGISGNQGWGKDYATAKKNRTANRQSEFGVTAKVNYGSTAVDGRIFRRVKHGADKALIVDALKDATKGLIQQGHNEWARYIYGNGSGRLAAVDASTNLGSDDLVLDTPDEIRTFDQDFPIDFVNPATGAARARTGDIKVVGVDEENNTLILSGVISTLCPTAAAGDLVVREGMAGNAPLGFDAWNPLWTSASDAILTTPFADVVRATFPSRLAGTVFDAAASGITSTKEIVLAAIIKNAKNKGNAKQLFLHPDRWNDLRAELDDKVEFTKTPAAPIGKISTGVEYDGIEIIGVRGKVVVYSDNDAPRDVGRLVNLSAWTYGTAGPMFDWDVGEDGEWRIEDSADEREVRIVTDGEMWCEAPWENTAIKFAPYT